jgi:large subunit ribosomal protein L18e
MEMKINVEKSNIRQWISVAEKGSHGDSHPKMWKKVYSMVAVPRRSRCDANIYKINQCSGAGDLVIVPGKVLGTGTMDHSVSISAIEYSGKARSELEKAKCTILDINALYKSAKEKKQQVKIIKR